MRLGFILRVRARIIAGFEGCCPSIMKKILANHGASIMIVGESGKERR